MSVATEDSISRRCVRRHSVRLNKGKADDLHALIDMYAREKEDHLRALTPKMFAGFCNQRAYRDHLLKNGYTSPYGLQARMWKMALKDADETMVKFWSAIAEDIRHLVHTKQNWSDEMRRYAFWLLYSPRRVAALYAGETPTPSAFKVSRAERIATVKIISRCVRKHAKRFPRVRKARSACFDFNMYGVTTSTSGRQQIEVMGLLPRKRISIPLLGTGPISGNLRIVMESGMRVAEVHTTFALDPPEIADAADAGVDIGQTEVLTDDHGKRYGHGFGEFLAEASVADLDKGRKRGKLHSVRKHAIAKGHYAKARRIKVNNLGFEKMGRRKKRHQAECARLVNTAFNDFLRHRKPTRFAQEKLDFRGKGRSKTMSRRTTQMRNATINERSLFKASAAGVCRKRVNPAYTSQPCPRCGYVHAKNRNGDRFVCLFCGWVGHSDWVGAHNLRNRMDDPDITLWMPKARVRTILLSRFSQQTGETPDWKPRGDCSGVDSRYQVTTRRRLVGAAMQVGGNGSRVCPVVVLDHPGQPESETAAEILTRGTTTAKRALP
jgi:putative transposase